MIKTIITIAALAVIPAQTNAAELPQVVQEQQTTIKPQLSDQVVLPPATPPKATIQRALISQENTPLGKKGEKATRIAGDWISRPILPTASETNGKVVYTFGVTMPVVICKPLRVCVLQLEKGEKIIDTPVCGDTAQWQISPSRADDRRAPHIYIKPLDSGLSTNLTIVTDRRTYMIALKSRNDKYTPLVSFRYPKNEAKRWDTFLATQQATREEREKNNTIKSGQLVFDAEGLDFDYTLKGDAKWKPLRVFNDGVKTYLKMPKIMQMYEAPVLLTVNDGQEALVNYRLHGDLYIVDQLFESAILISGVGSAQRKITVIRDSELSSGSGVEDTDEDFN